MHVQTNQWRDDEQGLALQWPHLPSGTNTAMSVSQMWYSYHACLHIVVVGVEDFIGWLMLMCKTLYGIVSLEYIPILTYWMPLGINSFAQMQPYVGIPLLDLAPIWPFLSFLGYFSLLGRSPMRRRLSKKNKNKNQKTPKSLCQKRRFGQTPFPTTLLPSCHGPFINILLPKACN